MTCLRSRSELGVWMGSDQGCATVLLSGCVPCGVSVHVDRRLVVVSRALAAGHGRAVSRIVLLCHCATVRGCALGTTVMVSWCSAGPCQ